MSLYGISMHTDIAADIGVPLGQHNPSGNSTIELEAVTGRPMGMPMDQQQRLGLPHILRYGPLIGIHYIRCFQRDRFHAALSVLCCNG